MACRTVIPSFGHVLSQALTALPKPYQAGSINRHCAQLNTHGMARRSSIRDDGLRDDGRLADVQIGDLVDDRRFPEEAVEALGLLNETTIGAARLRRQELHRGEVLRRC